MTNQSTPIKRLPLRARECTDLEFLFWAYSAIVEAHGNLGSRLDTIGKSKRYASLATELGKIVAMLLDTVPVEKICTLKKNLKHQTMRIVTKGMQGTASDGFAYVDTDCLRELCRIATDEECLMCNGCGPDMAGCKLRKALKGTIMIDLDEKDGICMGKKIMTQWE